MEGCSAERDSKRSMCRSHYKEYKREYDKKYRAKHAERRAKQKKEWFKKHYAENPELYRERRKRKRADHARYCRSSAYKNYKKKYDAKRQHGEWRECYELMEQIFKLVRGHFDTDYERRVARGYYFQKYGIAEPVPTYLIDL